MLLSSAAAWCLFVVFFCEGPENLFQSASYYERGSSTWKHYFLQKFKQFLLFHVRAFCIHVLSELWSELSLVLKCWHHRLWGTNQGWETFKSKSDKTCGVDCLCFQATINQIWWNHTHKVLMKQMFQSFWPILNLNKYYVKMFLALTFILPCSNQVTWKTNNELKLLFFKCLQHTDCKILTLLSVSYL